MNTPIERLMEKHDMSRDEAEEILDDLQEDSDDPIICAKCGQFENRDEGIVVHEYTLPDGSMATLDNECFAEIIEEDTTLARRESQVVADWIAGLTYGEISTHRGIAGGNISKHKQTAREKGADAVDQLEIAPRTITIIKQFEEAER